MATLRKRVKELEETVENMSKYIDYLEKYEKFEYEKIMDYVRKNIKNIKIKNNGLDYFFDDNFAIERDLTLSYEDYKIFEETYKIVFKGLHVNLLDESSKKIFAYINNYILKYS